MKKEAERRSRSVGHFSRRRRKSKQRMRKSGVVGADR